MALILSHFLLIENYELMSYLQRIFNNIINVGYQKNMHDRVEHLRIKTLNSAIFFIFIVFNAYLIPANLFLGLNAKYLVVGSIMDFILIIYFILTYQGYLHQSRHLIIISVLGLVIGLNIVTGIPLVNMLFPLLPLIPAIYFLFDEKTSRLYQMILIIVLFGMVLLNTFLHAGLIDNDYYIASFLFIVCFLGLLAMFRYVVKSNTYLLEDLERQQEITLQSQDIADVGSWYYDFDTQTLQWSDKMYKMFGKPTTDIPTYESHMKDIIPKDFRNLFSGKGHREEFKFQYSLHINGQKRWYRLAGKTYNKTDSNKAQYMVGAIQDVTVQVQKDRSIAETNSKLKAALEATGNGIVIVERNTLNILLNRNIRTLFKIPPTVSDNTTPDVIRPYIFDKIENIDLLLELFDEINENPHVIITETIYLNDGRILALTSLPQKSGEDVIGRVYSLKDITDEHRAEQQLKFRERFFRNILANSYDGIVIYDETGLIKYTSPAIKKILGFKPYEVIDDSLFEYIHDEDEGILKQFLEEFPKLPATEEGTKGMFRYRNKEGHYVIIESITINRLNDPTIKGIISNFKDVTEEVNMKNTLMENEKRYRHIFENNQFGIININKDLKFQEVNKGVCDIFGYTKEEFLGLSMEDITHPEDIGKSLDHRTKLLSGEIDSFHFVKRYLRKDGSLIHGITTVNGVYGKDSTYEGSTVTIADITEVIEKEEKIEELVQQLQRSNHELSQFAYAASHDLQEPLRMVGNFVQLIEEEYGDKIDAQGRSYIQYAVNSVRRMSRLIDNLIDYAKVGDKNSAFKPLNIKNVLAAIEEEIAPLQKRRKVIIEKENLPEEVVYGDPLQLSSVFHSLILNGIKFNKSIPPIIKVACEEQEEFWKFTIQDNGIGIAPKNQEKVFEIFKKLHRKEVHDGTGVGLAMAKRIILYHGGTIGLSSELGKGSTFYFTIPKQPII